MKISAAALSLFALAGFSNAQYFSAGWSPGQKVPAAEPEAATFVPGQSPLPKPTGTAAGEAAAPPQATPFSFSSLLDINKLLTTEPAVNLFKSFGINITERVQTVLSQKIWDERVELITDDNYQDLIVNEPLTTQEEKDRLWVIVISVTSAKQEGVSKYMDQVFDAAYNESQIAGDLPHVRWGRIDYLNVTALTTKWGVWQAPYLVVLKDRGQELRFYRPYNLRLRDDAFRQFLVTEGWKSTPPWSSPFAPGGEREWVMDFLAVWLTKFYNLTVAVPKWMLLLISGSVGSLIVGFLHRPSKKDKEAIKAAAEAKAKAAAKAAEKAVNAVAPASRKSSAAPTDSERESSTPPAKRSSTRQRKTKK